MIHALKIKREYYEAVCSGAKTFEVRKNDRDFRPGDYLALNEINDTGEYTHRDILVAITYILDDPEFVKEGYVILGIRRPNYSI